MAIDKLKDQTQAKRVGTEITLESASKKDVLPRCPGPFGGTTILVLPKAMKQDETDQWLQVEKNDPLAAASRFHRLRIATSSGELTLPKVLDKLLAEKRKNILIVPTEFYASSGWLRELKKSVTRFEDDMTLSWLPGLGGQRGVLEP